MADGDEEKRVDWVIPVAHGVDLSRQSPRALQTLADTKGWEITRDGDTGKSNVDQPVVRDMPAPKKNP
jgi:hypothetical protein